MVLLRVGLDDLIQHQCHFEFLLQTLCIAMDSESGFESNPEAAPHDQGGLWDTDITNSILRGAAN